MIKTYIAVKPYENVCNFVCDVEEENIQDQLNRGMKVYLLDTSKLKEIKITLEELDNHDCHLSPEDSCDCQKHND